MFHTSWSPNSTYLHLDFYLSKYVLNLKPLTDYQFRFYHKVVKEVLFWHLHKIWGFVLRRIFPGCAVEILLLLFSCIFSGSTLYTRSRKSYSLYISIHWVHGRKLTDPQMALMENKESMTWLNVWWPSISWYQERHIFRMYQPNHHYHLQNWPA